MQLISPTTVPFLYEQAILEGRKIDTYLYTKPTDTWQYLNCVLPSTQYKNSDIIQSSPQAQTDLF